jgi:hypothetical protein
MRMDAADGAHPGKAPPGADDHLAVDLVTQDRIWTSDVAGDLRGDGRRFQAEAALAHGARRLVDDLVLRRSPRRQRKIESAELKLDADDRGIQDSKRFLEQFLPGLVAVHDYKCVRHIPSLVGIVGATDNPLPTTLPE